MTTNIIHHQDVENKIEIVSSANNLEQQSLIDEYLQLYNNSGDDRKTARALKKSIGKLNSFYWKRVEEIVQDAIDSSREVLTFSDEDKLFIDMGFIDKSIVEGADEGIKERLVEERLIGGSPNHYYFTEWLEDRYKKFILSEQIEKQTAIENKEKNSELTRLKKSRKKILGKLKPFLKNLPGVNEQTTNHFLEGHLDDQLIFLSIRLLEESERPLYIRRYSLKNLRNQIILKLRDQLDNETDFKLADMLDVIYTKIWKESFKDFESGSWGNTNILENDLFDPNKIIKYLKGEVKFVKSLLPVGALAGGITKCCSVLLKNTERINKKITQNEFQRCRESDRGFNVSPVVLIAPFNGRGFFEWDRDSLFVPLVPVDSAKSSIANASANYRMLIDSFQHEGKLKENYKVEYPEENFQLTFQKDYRDWICHIGSGVCKDIDSSKTKLFMDNIGPDFCNVLAPPKIKNLDLDARKRLTAMLEKQLSTSLHGKDDNLHYRLGVLYWQENKIEKAIAQIAKSLAFNGKNGIALFSLGLLLRRCNNKEKSIHAFKVCIKRVPESIWATYSKLCLEEKLQCG